MHPWPRARAPARAFVRGDVMTGSTANSTIGCLKSLTRSVVFTKLILMSYKNAIITEQTRQTLDRIVSILESKGGQSDAPADDRQRR